MLWLSKQDKIGEISIILKRKIVTAVVSSLVFSLIFSIPAGFEGDLFYNLYYMNFMIVITFGVMTSIFSDWFSRNLSKKGVIREITSFLFHVVFGSMLQVFGLISAISFFIVDRLLIRVKIGWMSVVIALLIVVLAFIFLINR